MPGTIAKATNKGNNIAYKVHSLSYGTSSMKILVFSLLLSLCFFLPPSEGHATVKAPKEIGGFKLGTSIDDYEFISYRNFLKQVVVENVGAFRKGIIEYGVCERPGEIVKIKLKYADSSESFYRQLLQKYKQQLGEPAKYTGDSFGILMAWKWFFTDKAGERISLTLQYNKKNLDETLGSMVKLSMPDRINAERLCFNKMCNSRPIDSSIPEEQHEESFIPR